MSLYRLENIIIGLHKEDNFQKKIENLLIFC